MNIFAAYGNCPPVRGAPMSNTGGGEGFAEGMLIG